MKNETLPIVGISCGDPNGIGIEVILKSLKDNRILNFFTPVIFCNNNLVSDQKKQLNLETDQIKINLNQSPVVGKINIIDVWDDDFVTTFGKPTTDSGTKSFLSLQSAVKALINGNVNLLVTAPINKNNIQSEKFKFPGHTDYLAKELGGESLMFMICDELKIGLLTDHIPLKEINSHVTKQRIEQKFSLINESLKKDFGLQKPKIAVLSIDPHVGDGGVIGNDDQDILKPALLDIASKNNLVFGPFSSDSFFGSGQHKKYDAVLAIYHDQGLIPFKTLSFGTGVNYTAGLNKVRTSPDHGTGYDIAGKGLADSTSFKNAIFSGIDILKSRKLYDDLNKNPLTSSNSKTRKK
jgi:4-hydroxythreonine-4-phosphate dehydrogenase